MDKAQADRKRFFEDLPWYVNGTMEPEKRAWMDAYMAEHPGARNEWAIEQQMAAAFYNDEPDPELNRQVVQATLERIRAKQARAATSREGWRSWWRRTWAVPTPVFAAVLVAFVLPVWWAMQSANEMGGMRSMEASKARACAQQWRLRIAFGPDIPFDRAVILLKSVNANVVAGPTASGEFWLRWPTQAERDSAASALGRVDEVHDVFVPPADSEMGCLK